MGPLRKGRIDSDTEHVSGHGHDISFDRDSSPTRQRSHPQQPTPRRRPPFPPPSPSRTPTVKSTLTTYGVPRFIVLTYSVGRLVACVLGPGTTETSDYYFRGTRPVPCEEFDCASLRPSTSDFNPWCFLVLSPRHNTKGHWVPLVPALPVFG